MLNAHIQYRALNIDMTTIQTNGMNTAVIETANTTAVRKVGIVAIVAMATNTGAKAVKAAEAKKASVAEALAVAEKALLEEVRVGVTEVK